MSQEFNLEEPMKRLNKINIQKVVQRNLYLDMLKDFEKRIKKFSGGNLSFAKTMKKITDCLHYDDDGDGYNPEANLEYFTATGFTKMIEIFKRVLEDFSILEEKKASPEEFYKKTLWTTYKTHQEFGKYKILAPFNWLDRGDFGVEALDKILQAGKYEEFLSKSELRNSGVNANKINRFVRNAENLLNRLHSEFDFYPSVIREIFQTYEKAFYKTDYLISNNTCVTEYLLKSGENVYFSEKDLNNHEKMLEDISVVLDSVADDYKKLHKSWADKKLNERIVALAEANRNDVIKISDEPLIEDRPELSDAFTIACLDSIVENKGNFNIGIGHSRNLTDLIRRKEQSSPLKPKIEVDVEQPSLFDYGL